ncbi:hypothetical protein [Actinacidiphila oryziradicis]|uniref:hypothetical protein n=1 Tax=Actinacidiphila oryziradicis TaxID=2571141 RepID=UPI001FEA2340|nr:hypothetical protein [Actinacidiphila oryziradicis]
MRTMYDGVTPGNIPASATMVAGYADGLYANVPEMRARFPHATVVSIAVRYTTRAQVLDVENGDATPAEAVLWCTDTMSDKPNGELTVYCNTSTWPAVRSAFQTAHVSEPNYWVAQYDNDPAIPVGAIAKQYENTTAWDKSVVAEYWPGVDQQAAPAAAEIYPGASTGHWYDSGPNKGDPMTTNTIVWHSTETTVLPDYNGGSIAPNLTAVPDFKAQRLLWYQHFGFDTSSRALVHTAGQIATNTLNVAQVEIVGTCDPATHAAWSKAGTPHLYMPELPDWAVRDLAAFAKWCHDAHGVPLTSGLTWKPYPASYGVNGVRMSTTAWSNFKGHCGHMHVPENDHGDPGAFPIAAVLTTKPTPAPAPAPMPFSEVDMPLFTVTPTGLCGTSFLRGGARTVGFFTDNTLIGGATDPGATLRVVVWSDTHGAEVHDGVVVNNTSGKQVVIQFTDPAATHSVTVTRTDKGAPYPVFAEVS